MMTDRVLNKKNLLILCFLTLFIHALFSLAGWFLNADWLLIVDYCMAGLTGFAAVLYFAREKTTVRYQRAQMILMLFLLWYIISCLSMTIVFGSDWVNYNSYRMYQTALSVFFMFPLGYVLIREEKRSNIGQVLLHVLLLGWTLFILVVLVFVLQGKAIYTPNDGIIFIDKSTSLCLNCNRNTTGSWEMLFFLASCYMAFWNKKRSLRIIYIFASVIHYMALMLSGSRACILAVLGGFSVMVWIAVYMRLNKQQTTRRILFSTAVALVAGAAYYFLRDFLIRFYSASADVELGSRAKMYVDVELSGRTQIWKYTIEGIFTSLRMALFGVTPQSIPEFLAQMSDRTIVDTYTHNQLLEIAAGIGIPGLIIFLAWFFIILKDIYKLVFVEKNVSSFWAAPVIVLVLMAANMMEAYLVFFDHIDSYAFFLLCGIIHGKVNAPVTVRQLSRQEIRRKEQQQKKKKK